MPEDRLLADRLSGRIRRAEDAGNKRIFTGLAFHSPLGPGRLSSIHLPPPPDHLVSLMGADIPGTRKLPFGSTSIPVLSGKKILWPGQALLLAAGPNGDEIEEWLSQITLDILPFEEKDQKEHSPYRWEKGHPQEAFSRAFQVVEEHIVIPQTPVNHRSGGAVCQKDGAFYQIHVNTPWPGAVRRHVARTIKTERANIRVRSYAPNGAIEGASGLWLSSVEASRAALLSQKARKSIRYLPSPNRDTPGRPGIDLFMRGAIDAEGRVLAIEAEFTLHAGALFPLENEFMERIVLGLFSLYPCRHYIIQGKLHPSETAPDGFTPGGGFDLGVMAGELFASRIASNSLISPGLWRKASLPQPGQGFGPGIDLPRDFPIPNLLDSLMEDSDFDRKFSAYEQNALARSNLTHTPALFGGIGLSCAWFGNGFTPSRKDLGPASITLNLDIDGILEIDVPLLSPGDALQESWKAMVQDILGIEGKSVRFTGELPSPTLVPGPHLYGSDISVHTKLLELACREISKKRFRDPLPITVSRSRRKRSQGKWEPETLTGTPYEIISWGACAVETVVSTRTWEIQPKHIWLNIDSGSLLSPSAARTAVEAAAQEAIEWCMGSCAPTKKPTISVQFRMDGLKRTPRDAASLPWLLVPAAFIQSAKQAGGMDLDRLPLDPAQLGRGGVRL
ncbi:MAG: molybdopterin-dependent oxidoreductase [Spirochaetales bacterium]|nr:molybdopterin-dependent oxidoreductase [Spirochaetales bacterium]